MGGHYDEQYEEVVKDQVESNKRLTDIQIDLYMIKHHQEQIAKLVEGLLGIVSKDGT